MKRNELNKGTMKLIFQLFLFISILSLIPDHTYSQVKEINGKVISAESNAPILGVEILIKGKKDGTITDLDGTYTLKVVPGMELIFSAAGFKPQNIIVSDQTTIDVALEAKKTKKEIRKEKDDQTSQVEITDDQEVEKTPVKAKKNEPKKGYCYGKVTAGDTGWELLGVQVIVNGKGGTITDLEGYFEVKADSGDILSFAVPGYFKRHRVVQNQKQIDVMLPKSAKFPGSLDELSKFISRTLKYPSDAMDARIEGKVYVDFEINEDGSISDIRVSKPVYPSLDAEAVRIVKEMPKWEPAYFEKKPIKTKFNLPISFTVK